MSPKIILIVASYLCQFALYNQQEHCNPNGIEEQSNIEPPCKCKPFVTGNYCDQCNASAFHLSPTNPNGCIGCFCMGITTSCTSSNWYRQNIATTFVRSTEDFKIVRRQGIRTTVIDKLKIHPNQSEITYSSFSPSDRSIYYWLLPQIYLGDKVTSYGGVLNYTLRYVPIQGRPVSRNNASDVEIISNNEIRLFYYKRDNPLQPNALESVSVPLLEQYWQREDGQPTDREHLLMALANLSDILIKATYTTTTAEVGLQSVSLETAEKHNSTGLKPAYEVEDCHCPAGYRGLSCQECDAGYTRINEGFYLGLCVPCSCFGHSKDCDVDTGVCFNCSNHTTGPDCGQCEPGYTGDPKSGQPCYRICKTNVVGDNCTRCRSGTFDLQESHPNGCLECWCSGVSNQCQSSNLFYIQIPMPILDSNHGFMLSKADRTPFVDPLFDLNIDQHQIGFDYKIAEGQRLYWSLPPKFTGNKLSSYGGNLTWTQRYFAPIDAIPLNDFDLIIHGDGTSIFWYSGITTFPYERVTKSVKLEEKEFFKKTASGSQRASRADVLKVLSSIKAILIRATFRSQTSYVFISEVSMDSAVDQQLLSTVRTTQVEICRCPIGYTGLSCESCENGYYLDEFSDRRKECKRCPCNGREESCSIDVNAQVVCKCLPGFSGSNCKDTDEFLRMRVSIPHRIVAEHNTAQFQCYDEGPLKSAVTWTRGNGLPFPVNSIITSEGRLQIPNARVSDNGTYICKAVEPYSQYNGSEITAYLNVEPSIKDGVGHIDGKDCSTESPSTPPSVPSLFSELLCLDFEFGCDENICLPYSRRCDGSIDCRDKTDELGCPPPLHSSKMVTDNHKCAQNEFQCHKSKKCIPLEKKCDGNYDDCDVKYPKEIFDKSDEFDCMCNYATEFKCKSGQCIAIKGRCDNFAQCYDKSDEENCAIGFTTLITTCRPDQIECYDGACIEWFQRCNKVRDCPLGEDEGGCPLDPTTPPPPLPAECSSSEFKCGDGSCIDISRKCNRQVDCSDGSDENDCPSSICLSSEFRCNDGYCIPFARRCDRYPDCRDGTDELECPITGQEQSTPSFQVLSSTDPTPQQPTIFVTIREPGIQIVPLGSTLRYNCRAQSIYNLPVVVKWSKEEGILPPARSIDDGNGNLVLVNAAASDSGTYVCTTYDSRAYVSQRVYVLVGEVSIDENISLNGDGFVGLPGSLLPHPSTYISIFIYFTTRANEGLLLWHGQHENVNGKDYDYIAIGIVNGYVELSFKSGHNERVLRATDNKVNDGKEHVIRAVRREETVQFELDAITSELATLEDIFNINGNIFVGGSPNTLMTGNLYRRGFVGCINLLSIQNGPAINFGTEATSARNVAQCSSSSYED